MLWSYAVAPGYHQKRDLPASSIRAPCTPALCHAMQNQAHPGMIGIQRLCDVVRALELVEKAPEEKQYDDGNDTGNRTVLFEKQFPVDADSRALVLGRVFAKTAAHVTHLVQAVTAVKKIVDVLGHGFMDILELIVEAVEIVLCAAILVQLLCALKEAFKFGVGVRSHAGVKVLVAVVGALKLLADVLEVREGEFLRVAALGDANKDEAVVNHVATHGGG